MTSDSAPPTAYGHLCPTNDAPPALDARAVAYLAAGEPVRLVAARAPEALAA